MLGDELELFEVLTGEVLGVEEEDCVVGEGGGGFVGVLDGVEEEVVELDPAGEGLGPEGGRRSPDDYGVGAGIGD